MKVPPFALILLTSLTPVFGASVTNRLDRLENQVSEIQLLLNQLNKRTLQQREALHTQSTMGSRHYLVRSGDSYWSIARSHNVSVASLEYANPGINPLRLRIGKAINIPGSTARVTHSNNAAQTGTGTYRVKKGDILGRISEAHGIRLHQLLSANPGLNPKRLKVGAVLTIPGQPKNEVIPPLPRKERREATPPAPRSESVKAVETRRNPYGSQKTPEIQRVSRDLSGMAPEKQRLVSVSRDSRLSEIARLHNTTVAEINHLNDVELSPDQMIRSGSQLYVPAR
ncbi:MAG: LysM repeat protein [Paracoccaceae bacterium]|jgi:LysM repeat protein